MTDVSTSRVAVVTGGDGAIGGAIVRELARLGHRVVVLDRAGDIACDLAVEQDVRRAAAEVLETYGRVDVLVHSAAASDLVELDTVDLATWRRIQAVNVESALLLSQAFTPGMRERKFGRIVLITSDTVWKPPSADLLGYITS